MSYITRDDIDAIYGSANVDKWADKNGDADADDIAAAIQSAIDWAEDEVDGLFKPSVYAVPLSPVDNLLKRWCAKLAAVELYRQRGMREEGDEQAGKMKGVEKQVRSEIGLYVCGVRRGAWGRSYSSPSAPVGI